MEIELVLDAKMHEALVIMSSSENNLRFTSSDSTIASITTSADRRSFNSKVNLRRFKASEIPDWKKMKTVIYKTIISRKLFVISMKKYWYLHFTSDLQYESE